MDKTAQFLRFAMLPVATGLLFLACKMAPVMGKPLSQEGKLVDGVYEGSYRGGPNKVLVRVAIKDNKIVNIQIVEHWAWRGRKAESVIVNRIIDNQSTDVDVVSGATNSSRVIMNAVQRAVEKAR